MKTKPKWPDGPYLLSKKRNRVCTAEGRILAQVFLPPHRLNRDARLQAHEESAAVGSLMAAAPDLYEALEGVIRVADRKTDEFDAALAALARARGEQP